MSCNSVLHGFAGYFETTLYKDVTLSMSLSPKVEFSMSCAFELCTHVFLCVCVAGIKPDTHSPGMFSWFPILFPLKVSLTHFIQKTICSSDINYHLSVS